MPNTTSSGTSTNALFNANPLVSCDPNTTCGSILQVANNNTGLTGSLQTVYDGAGNASPLQLSTSTVNVTSFNYNNHSVAIGATFSTTGTFTTGASFLTTAAVSIGAAFTTTGTVNIVGNVQIGANFTISGSANLTFTMAGNTNVTLPLSGTLYGTASGSITSSQLATSLTDETGTGHVVFDTSPTVITPTFQGSHGFSVLTFLDNALSTDYWQVQASTSNAATLQVLSSNTNAIGNVLGKGTGGVAIGGSGLTTTPIILTNMSHIYNISIPTWTGNRTLTLPDSNVSLSSASNSILTLSAGAAGVLGAGSTYYIGSSSGNTTINQCVVYIPFACSISQMYCTSQAAPSAGQTQTWTIYKNGSSTAITAIMSGTSAAASDLTHGITCAAGDYLQLQIVMSGSAANTNYVCASLQLTPI